MFFTPKQVADKIGVTTKTIRAWCRSGIVKCIKTPGGHRRIPEPEVERLLGGTNNEE